MIRWLGDEDCHDPAVVGGKAAALSRLAAGHLVPPGFALPSDAAARIASGPADQALIESVASAYSALGHRTGTTDPPVAVRSSALDEDGAESSFAGQHQTFLNVRGLDSVIAAVRGCVESAGTETALSYRASRNLAVDEPVVAVLIQSLVASDVSIVAFSANPISRSRDEIVINASWGLGESIVGGTVTPDMFVIRKPGLEVVSTTLAVKSRMTVLAGDGTREVTVPRPMQQQPSLQGEHITRIGQLALALEQQVGACVDIEAAIHRGELYLLQCRPITTLG